LITSNSYTHQPPGGIFMPQVSRTGTR
jgi:hypothetical protein